MKKILAIMLSVMMVLCMMPSMAFAGSPSSGETTQKTELTKSNTTISLSAEKVTYTGASLKPTVTVTYTAENKSTVLAEGKDYTVSYTKDSAPTTDFKNAGTITVNITAVADSLYTVASGENAPASKTYTIAKKDLSSTSQISQGNIKTGSTTLDGLKAAIVLKHDNYTLESGDFDVYSGETKISDSTDIKAGTNTFIVKPTEENSNYNGQKTVTLTGGESISTGWTVNTSPATPNFTYDGTPKKFTSITLTKTDGGKTTTLYEGKDFYVTYSNNTDAGTNTASFTITGQGSYAGKIENTPFSIASKSLESNNISVDPIDNQTINSTPKIVVYDRSISTTKPLVEGTDYTYTLENIDKVGTATVTIVGHNNYTGSIKRTYQVKDSISPQYVTVLKSSFDYTGYAISPEVIVKSATKTYVLNRDYKIVGGGKTNADTYNFSIVGMGDYGGTLYTGTYSIVARSLSSDPTAKATLSSDTVLYNGKKAEPAVTVTCNGRTLVKNVDYTVSYYNNDKIGTATMYIYGKGNYTGSITKTFRIVGKDLSSLSATLSQTTYNYSGLEHKPTVTIYDGTKKLVSGTDYTVAYKDNKNCGTATVTITGKGNYSGTKTLTFTIVGKDQSLTTNYTYYTKYLTSSAFNLNAQTDGDGVIVYESSDKSVATVSATGTVTVHGTGIAYITVKTTKDVKYNPASKTVKVTVKPKKPAFKLTTPAKKQVKVTITKVDGATKYQVRYGRMGSYKNRYIAHNDNGYDTTYVTLKNLKPGKNYFIKVRSYKTLSDGTKVWGNWTVIKKIKTK